MDTKTPSVKDSLRCLDRRKADLHKVAADIEAESRKALTLGGLRLQLSNLVAVIRERAKLLHEVGEDLIADDRAQKDATAAEAKKGKK